MIGNICLKIKNIELRSAFDEKNEKIKGDIFSKIGWNKHNFSVWHNKKDWKNAFKNELKMLNYFKLGAIAILFLSKYIVLTILDALK